MKPSEGLPSAIEAEQAILGLILFDNAIYATLPPGLQAAHFAEPFHQRLFQRIRLLLDRGDLADPVTISVAMASDPALKELGGMAYLADLFDNASSSANANAYARAVMQVSVRRTLMKTGAELVKFGGDTSVEPDDILAELEETIGELHMTGSTLQLVSADDAMASTLDYIDNPGDKPAGVTTGFEPLDDHLGPMLPGDLIVLGGRPGMGKSAVAGIISRNVAVNGMGVIEIHAEMSVEQAWRRRLTATAFGIYAHEAPAYSDLRKRRVTFNQRQMLDRARDVLTGIPLMAIKRTGLTIGRLRALVIHQQALWERKGIRLGLVVIDHVGLIRTEREHSSRVDQQTEISNGLKALADNLKIPVLALAQLNRSVESRDNKRPTLPDLRDSGSWEQDADVVIGAYRDAYYARQEQAPSESAKSGATWAEWQERVRSPWIEALLLKVREGEPKTIKLWAHMPTNTVLGMQPDDSLGGLI